MKQIKNRIHCTYRTSSVFRIRHPRKTQLYCVGTAKSGTHSIAAIFGDSLRSAHEAEDEPFIDFILDKERGLIDSRTANRYVKDRDRRLWLEIDSSQLNYFIIKILVDLFPKGRFVLTIRNPYSWLDSFINHQMARPVTDAWANLRDYRFKEDQLVHSEEDAPLSERGLYTLDGYLSYWAEHNQSVLNAVPPNRLLVVRTDNISEKTEKIAQFAGVPAQAADRARSHAFRARERYNVLSELDPAYLQSRVDVHCKALTSAHFPDLENAHQEVSRLYSS